ncbi:MAG: matrixin family metalloprotease [Phycisphaeraceae bacterium]|nr:matrixin family metalloprotease [Phycisphaeraceae bacterium]
MQRPIAAPSITLAASATIAALSLAPAAPTATSTPISDEASMARCIETGSLAAIFAPGTDPEVVMRVSQMIQLAGNDRFSPGTRWPGADNTPVVITYSYPSDGITVPNGVGGGSQPNVLHATLDAQFGSEAAWKAQFDAIFQDWSDITGNTYVEVPDDDAPMGSFGPLDGGSGRGDIRITSISIDGSSGILAYNYFPTPLDGDGGDMVIDSNENWANPSGGFIFFRNTLSHEHGHGMGLGHVCPADHTKLMEPFLNSNFDGPQHDDIRGATFLYGDYFEPDNNSASAGFIGDFFTPGSEPFALIDMALRDNADDDYYSFTVSGPGSIDVAVEIVGDIYENHTQDAQCAPNGVTFDSFVLVDPDLAVLDTDGATPLASVNANGFGGDETLTSVALPAAGTYYIRVQSVAANGSAQIYNLNGAVTLDKVAVGCVADLNSDGIVDTADLGILLGVFGTSSPAADLNGDMTVDTADLGILLGVFGTCTEG